MATAFQIAIVALERECRTLRGQNEEEESINRCERLKNLAICYMDWAMYSKIPIKLDVDLQRPWVVPRWA
jgi:hypothetical protein